MSDIPAYQQRLLDAITEFSGQHQRPPTIYEMADELGVVISHITQTAKRLRDKGLLHKRRGLHLPNSVLYRPIEAAEELGIGRSTLNAWVTQGLLSTVRSPGGYHLIPYTEVERLKIERHTPQFGVDFDLDAAWCNWLVGFTDGEGTFSLVEHKVDGHGHYYGARYQLFQRSDRRWILEQAREYLRCGYLYQRNSKGQTGPGTYYVVNDHASLVNIIAPFFDRYPPRMKHREYAVWREALMLIVDGNHNFNRIAELREQLRDLYAYHED